jgi:hypothetical protein
MSELIKKFLEQEITKEELLTSSDAGDAVREPVKQIANQIEKEDETTAKNWLRKLVRGVENQLRVEANGHPHEDLILDVARKLKEVRF